MNKNKICLATITFKSNGAKKESVRGAIFKRTDRLYEVPLKWKIPFRDVRKITVMNIGD